MAFSFAGLREFLDGPHQGTLEELSPGNVTIGGTSYKASVVLDSIEEMLMDGGRRTKRVAHVEIRKAVYGTTAPTTGTKVTHSSIVYRVTSVDGLDVIDPVWRLDCEEEYK